MSVQYEELYKKVLPVLESKMDEIKYYEYEGITIEDIWHFCIQKKWRKRNIDELRLYEVVGTIYSLKASDIVSHFQIQQFQTTNWFNEFSQDELTELLKPVSHEKEQIVTRNKL